MFMPVRMQEKKSDSCVLYMGTFLPRECGIATFTNDLVRAMDTRFNPILRSEVLAMNDNGTFYNYNGKVSLQIDQNEALDYIEAAKEINARDDIKIVSIQHEFGIFGGEHGEYLLLFLNELRKPVVVTLHTVLPNPTEHMKDITKAIIGKCSAVVVMAKDAKRLLIEHYGVQEQEKVFHVPHGVPIVPFSLKEAKSKLNLNGKIVLSTFGLLSRGKGIEYVIKALPKIVEKFPNTIYLVIGETHPQIRKGEGESYRKSLESLVDKLNLKKNVVFLNRYMSLDEIIAYLKASDVYIAPGLDENQIVSGTISYALGCGKAIVSTSTAYAREVLSKDRGILVGFRNPGQISKAVNALLSDSRVKGDMEKRAYQMGRKMIWPNVAAEYLRVFNKVIQLREETVKKFPMIKLDHLSLLTDSVGIIHHAKHSVPNRKTGYTLDDNARALIVASKHYGIFASIQSLRLMKTYLSFLHYMQTESGMFHNFMDYSRKFLDERGSEDSYGRVLMACGHVISGKSPENVRAMAKFIFDRAVVNVLALESPRAKAFSLIGLRHYYSRHRHKDIIEKAEKIADSLAGSYRKNSAGEWKWFESYLTYSNARLPEAMFAAYEIKNDRKYLRIAEESLGFLSKTVIADNKLVLIGNKGWYNRGSEKALFDQQPVDASSMVSACLTAYRVTGKQQYHSNAVLAFNWFLGKNTLNQMVYDEGTGGCFDGLSDEDINLNQGAESTIAYLLARLELEEASANALGR